MDKQNIVYLKEECTYQWHVQTDETCLFTAKNVCLPLLTQLHSKPQGLRSLVDIVSPSRLLEL